MKRPYRYELKTYDEGCTESTRVPSTTKSHVTALLLLSSWGNRTKKELIQDPFYLDFHEVVQDFLKKCDVYRDEYRLRDLSGSLPQPARTSQEESTDGEGDQKRARPKRRQTGRVPRVRRDA